MEEYKEQDLVSSVNAVDSFVGGHVWKDMSTLINERIQLLQMELENCTEFDEIRYTQGKISELRAIEALPEHLKECIVQQKQIKNKEQEHARNKEN